MLSAWRRLTIDCRGYSQHLHRKLLLLLFCTCKSTPLYRMMKYVLRSYFSILHTLLYRLDVYVVHHELCKIRSKREQRLCAYSRYSSESRISKHPSGANWEPPCTKSFFLNPHRVFNQHRFALQYSWISCGASLKTKAGSEPRRLVL